MKISFVKYHGTGNDFILINDWDKTINAFLTPQVIKYLCCRRFGIGADGLILLQSHHSLDFEMIYYNADGFVSSMCGNGGRCLVHFARNQNLIVESCKFDAIDGIHEARIDGNKVELKMQDVSNISNREFDLVLDTGSPHLIRFVSDIQEVDVEKEGREIRNQDYFVEKGINVNFVAIESQNCLSIGTYERGVEAETFSCGTGVVAACVASHFAEKTFSRQLEVITKGGILNVNFNRSNESYHDIWLIGPAVAVFNGTFDTDSI